MSTLDKAVAILLLNAALGYLAYGYYLESPKEESPSETMLTPTTPTKEEA